MGENINVTIKKAIVAGEKTIAIGENINAAIKKAIVTREKINATSKII